MSTLKMGPTALIQKKRLSFYESPSISYLASAFFDQAASDKKHKSLVSDIDELTSRYFETMRNIMSTLTMGLTALKRKERRSFHASRYISYLASTFFDQATSDKEQESILSAAFERLDCVHTRK